MGLDNLESLRARIEATQREIADIRKAYVTDDEIAERVRGFIGSQERLVEDEVFGLASQLACYREHMGTGYWPLVQGNANELPELAFALAVCLNKERFFTEAVERAKAFAESSGHRREHNDGRQEKLASLKKALFALEMEEEREIERLEAEGQQITRRFDADPRAILGFIDDELLVSTDA